MCGGRKELRLQELIESSLVRIGIQTLLPEISLAVVNINKRILTYFVWGSITIRLTSCLTWLDSTAGLLVIQLHIQRS